MSRYKIVILPTQKEDLPNGIAKYLPTGKLSYSQYSVFNCDINEKWEQQHLYIVDTEADTGKEDWLLSEYDEVVHCEALSYWENHLKIIASTDSSLGLPTISETYIRDLINHIDSPILKYEIHGGSFIPFIDYNFQERNKPQVDFDLLKNFISDLKAFGESEKYATGIRNAVLFFELEEVKKIIERN